MSLAGEFRRRLTMLLHRGRFQRELDEEMRLHLELRRQQQIASGLSDGSGPHAASGDLAIRRAYREKSHMAWGWEWLETFLQDAGYGLALHAAHAGHHGRCADFSGPWHRRQYCHLQLSWTP